MSSCKNVDKILSRIGSESLDDKHSRSVSRMKEIVSSIVTKRAKISTTRRREHVESVWL